MRMPRERCFSGRSNGKSNCFNSFPQNVSSHVGYIGLT